MATVTVERRINAPSEIVFTAISDFERQPEISPDVLQVEFVGERKRGAGTRFRETRRMGKKTRAFDLEVAEYDDGHLRTLCDFDGITWDTTMTVSPTDDGCTLRMTMDARGHSVGKRLMAWVFAPLFRRGIAGHMDRLAGYCERNAMAQSRS